MDEVEKDLSLLRRPPIETVCRGFQDAKNVWEHGTKEVRKLLLNECNLIYECNYCRNMFRSITNFLMHKRSFCRDFVHVRKTDGNSDGDDDFINQNSGFNKSQQQQKESKVEKIKMDITKDENSIINDIKENLILNNMKSKFNSDDLQEKIEKEAQTIKSVEKTKNIVSNYPTIEKQPNGNESDNCIIGGVLATEVLKEIILTKDEKMKEITSGDKIAKKLTNKNAAKVSAKKMAKNISEKFEQNGSNEVICKTCQASFPTTKAAKIHYHRKHVQTHSKCLPCPSPGCLLTFAHSTTIMRHLAKDHKETASLIQPVRETVIKRSIENENDQPTSILTNESLKFTSNVVDELKTPTANILQYNNYNSKTKKQKLSCTNCNMTFDCKSVLMAHSLNCHQNQTVDTSTITQNIGVAAAGQQKIEFEKVAKLQKLATIRLLENHFGGNEDLYKENKEIKTEDQVDNSTFDIDMESLHEMFANLEKQQQIPSSTDVTAEKTETSTMENNSGVSEIKIENNNNSSNATETTLEMSQQLFVENNKDLKSEVKEEVETVTTNNTQEKNDSSADAVVIKVIKKRKMVKQLSCCCKICKKQFNALSNLRRHISMFHYRSQKFGCKLCSYRAFRRYDIVNHLCFTHKMTDERDKLSMEYVNVSEDNYSKDDMDDDIVVMGEQIEDKPQDLKIQFEENESLKTSKNEQTKNSNTKGNEATILISNETTITDISSYSNGSIKTVETTATTKKSMKSLRQPTTRLKSKRLLSNSLSDKSSENDTKEQQEKRPTRNRIKPVNKDFVYDLSNLCKNPPNIEKDHNQMPPTTRKRRSNGSQNTDTETNSSKDEGYSSFYFDESLPIEPLINEQMELDIRGAGRRITLQTIHLGLAKSATLPELPTERPQMRTRPMLSKYSVPIIDADELEAARMKSTLLDDAFLVKMARHSVDNFKIKPCMALEHSTLDNLLKKVDNNLKYNATIKDICQNTNENSMIIENSNKISMDNSFYPADVTDLNPALIKANEQQFVVDPEIISIPNYTSPSSAPRKRITLMQRLADNAAAAKHRDTLLRAALEN